jgi:hypothetical protein
MNQANIGGRYLNNGAWTDSGENAQKDENNEDIRRYRKMEMGKRDSIRLGGRLAGHIGLI